MTRAPENIGSQKVLEKASLLFEGHMREALWVKGKWRDSLLYSILENEWNGQREIDFGLKHRNSYTINKSVLVRFRIRFC